MIQKVGGEILRLAENGGVDVLHFHLHNQLPSKCPSARH